MDYPEIQASALPAHGLLRSGSGCFFLLLGSMSAQQSYGKYQDEDEQTEQTKLNHAGAEDAGSFG